MTAKLSDQGLDTLERRFQALRDHIRAMPEACRPELEGALQDLSQAIAALRAAGGTSPAEAPDCPEADSPAPADTILFNIFRAIPDLLTVIDRDFNIIMSNWHESDNGAGREPGGAGPSATRYIITGNGLATPAMSGRSLPPVNRRGPKRSIPWTGGPGNSSRSPS